MSYAIDWNATDKNTIAVLASELRPRHYKDIFRSVVQFDYRKKYSDKTKDYEKFRQRYGDENSHYAICTLEDGWIALNRWFVQRHQLSLFAPAQREIIKGDCLVSFEKGYEFAHREPHMKNWYGDSGHRSRYERRRLAYLAEGHVSDFFKLRFPDFWRAPDNEGDYKAPCNHDFKLVLPFGYKLLVDVKTPSYEENGNDVYVVRNNHIHMVYISAEWQHNQCVVNGWSSGSWIEQIGRVSNPGLHHVGGNALWSIEILMVVLTMAKAGMDWRHYDAAYREHLAKSNKAVA